MIADSPTKPRVSLTDPAFIRRLESLALLARRVLGGKLQASRRTTRKGSGVNFADYAEYNLGDDYRAIDWRVFGRLEHLVIKLFELEEDMTLAILLDTSRSMQSKMEHATKLAAALGYIALTGLDQVVVYTVSDKLDVLVEPCHGRAKLMSMLRSLERVECAGVDSDFNVCCKTFQARHRRRTMVVPISDFFFPGGFDTGLSLLRYGKHEVFAIQVQDERDRVCDLRGDADLQCVETGARRRVTVTQREKLLYEAAVEQWNESLRSACARRQIGLTSITTDIAFDEIISRILRRGGLVA